MKKLVFSAAPTPFTEDCHLDVISLENMLNRNLSLGTDGFFFSGGMGEWSQYDRDFKVNLAAEARRIVGNRARVLMGVTETGLHKTIQTMKAVSCHHPDACVLMLPPSTMTQYTPADYLEAVLDAAELPVFYYHCPQVNGMSPTIDDLARLAQHPNFKGIKNSSTVMDVRRELLLLRQDSPFILLEGDEWAIDEAIMLGCDGVLCGGCCLAGRMMRAIVDAAEEGDYATAQRMQYKLIRLFHGIYRVDGGSCRLGLKYALMKLGIFSNYKCLLRESRDLTLDDMQRIDQVIESYRDDL